jgi:phenylpyruvate tautomerase PptA (4-oxalocrotonate tautomerase family)
MPLTKIYAPAHLPAETVAQLADSVHASLVRHCKVPAADFFQLIQRMPPGSMRIHPNFPNVTRSQDTCVVEIAFLQGRTDDQKRALYGGIVEGAPAFSPDDIMVALIENSHMDWSLGRGQAYADLHA